jgi:hypothetical protein
VKIYSWYYCCAAEAVFCYTAENSLHLTGRRIMVWERQATESLIKKTITMGANDILPNFVAGGMDAVTSGITP